ncbi:MAG TPA: HIT domain-containing protein [Patescibacteria group bacterium]|nr:HIT domain-containing protein [Patescibacteria group bacterium]
MEDCIFCKIVRGDIPKEFDYEDDEVVAFADIHPLSPVHLLVIPKKHIEDFFHVDDKTHMAIANAIKKLIDKKELMGKGYRISVNGGGAQDVNHLHFHLRGPVGRGE